MSKSILLQRVTPLALALLIGALTVVALYERLNHAEQSTSEIQAADSYTNRAQERIWVECTGLDVAASARCQNEIIQTANENRTAQQDLEQQTEMARWAFWMMIASFSGVVITAVGVVYVRLTLDQTVAANKAAQAAVQVTRETGRDQARAYVEVSEVKFYWGNRHGSKPQFKIVISNHGQTPAKWFQIRQGYAVIEHAGRKEPEHFEDLPLGEDFGPTWNGINPTEHGMRASGPEITNWKEIKKCWRDPPSAKGMPPDNTHGVLVFGEIRYCTIFDEVFRSQFLFGAGTLESFDGSDAVEKENIKEGDVTYKLTSVTEKPQILGRNPLRLKLYERETD